MKVGKKSLRMSDGSTRHLKSKKARDAFEHVAEAVKHGWHPSGKGAGLKSFVDREAPLKVPMISPPAKQQRTWSCGPASLVNASAALGLDVTEAEARELTGADSNGTDEVQLIAGILQLGLTAHAIEGSDPATVGVLSDMLMDGATAIICVDAWDHWVAVVGVTPAGALVVQDPADGSQVEVSPDDLLERWWCPNVPVPLYGLALSLS